MASTAVASERSLPALLGAIAPMHPQGPARVPDPGVTSSHVTMLSGHEEGQTQPGGRSLVAEDDGAGQLAPQSQTSGGHYEHVSAARVGFSPEASGDVGAGRELLQLILPSTALKVVGCQADCVSLVAGEDAGVATATQAEEVQIHDDSVGESRMQGPPARRSVDDPCG